MRQKRVQWLRTNQAVGFAGVLGSVFLAAHLVLSPETFLKLSDGFYLGFFPLAGIALLLATSLVMTVDSWRNQVPPDLATLSIRQVLTVLIVVLAAWGYFWLMRSAGVLIATPIFLGLSSYALGYRSRRKAVLNVIICTIIGYLLVKVLDLPSLLGPLGNSIPF